MSVQLLSDRDLLDLPPIEWLVKDFLALDSKASFWGQPGSYKSFLAFDLAATLAAGEEEWCGMSLLPTTRTKKRPLVIYIAAEGGAGLAKRRKAWGTKYPKAGELNLKYVVQPVLIHENSESMKELEGQLDALIEYHEEGEAIEINEDEGVWLDRDGRPFEYYPDSIANEWPALIVIDTLVGSQNLGTLLD